VQVAKAPSKEETPGNLTAGVQSPSPLEIVARVDTVKAIAEPEPLPANASDQIQTEVKPSFPEATPAIGWQGVLLSLWLAGCVLWFVVAAVSISRFRRLLQHAQVASNSIRNQAEELALRLGLRRCPDIACVPGAISPMLWALGGRPRLLLPSNLVDRLSEEQQATLLAHELAHLRRRDHWVRGLELVVTGLFWWHPVVWWARRELREAEEQCCDAWVLWLLPKAARAYADALLETIDFLSRSRLALPQTASGIGQIHLLRRRLTMIMRGPSPKALSAAAFLAVLALSALLLPLRPTWARTEPSQRPDDPDEQVSALEQARATVQQLQAQVEIQKVDLQRAEAALKQAEVSLQQALRQLQALEKGATAKRAPVARTIQIEVTNEKGKSVIRVEGEVVALSDLRKILSPYVHKAGETNFVIDAGKNVDFRTVADVQDALRAAGAAVFLTVSDLPKRKQSVSVDRLAEFEMKLDALREELAILRHQAGSASAPQRYKEAYREYTRAAQALREARVFQGHGLAVSSVAWSPDGKLALSGSHDTTLRLWDVASGKEIHRFTGHEAKVLGVAFSPDGRFALSGAFDDNVILWDLKTTKELRQLRRVAIRMTSVAFSSDGRRVLNVGEDGYVRIWELETGKEAYTERLDSPLLAVAFAPDGKRVVAGCLDGTLHVWDAASLREQAVLGLKAPASEREKGAISQVAFSPDGRQIASAKADGTVYLWDAARGKIACVFKGSNAKMTCVAFSPDGRRLAAGGLDNKLRIWDTRTGALSWDETLNSAVLSVAFSPNGRFLLSGGEDGTVRLWALSSVQANYSRP
jgi:beta-lactamase regulating signal transducer with metallopeptidase domain/biopolymer transport protein ExbD